MNIFISRGLHSGYKITNRVIFSCKTKTYKGKYTLGEGGGG